MDIEQRRAMSFMFPLQEEVLSECGFRDTCSTHFPCEAQLELPDLFLSLDTIT